MKPEALPAIHRHEVVVLDSAIDANGHTNNVEYLRWMQAAAISHANATGCTTATIAAGASWVVRSHHVEYLPADIRRRPNRRPDMGLDLPEGRAPCENTSSSARLTVQLSRAGKQTGYSSMH